METHTDQLSCASPALTSQTQPGDSTPATNPASSSFGTQPQQVTLRDTSAVSNETCWLFYYATSLWQCSEAAGKKWTQRDSNNDVSWFGLWVLLHLHVFFLPSRNGGRTTRFLGSLRFLYGPSHLSIHCGTFRDLEETEVHLFQFNIFTSSLEIISLWAQSYSIMFEFIPYWDVTCSFRLLCRALPLQCSVADTTSHILCNLFVPGDVNRVTCAGPRFWGPSAT